MGSSPTTSTIYPFSFLLMFPRIEVANAFKWAWFKVSVDWRDYYLNLSDARKFTWNKKVDKVSIKEKVEQSLGWFISFFHETQRVK